VELKGVKGIACNVGSFCSDFISLLKYKEKMINRSQFSYLIKINRVFRDSFPSFYLK